MHALARFILDRTSTPPNGGSVKRTALYKQPLNPDWPTIGTLLTNAGYRCVHFGKDHSSGGLAGFDQRCEYEEDPVEAEPGFPINHDTRRDAHTARRTIEWIKHESHSDEQPFCCVLNLQNPHNICGWVGENAEQCGHLPVPEPLPELPQNFSCDDLVNRAKPVQYLCCAHNRQQQSCHWDDTTWRQYRAAYEHYCHRADVHIRDTLSALDEAQLRDDTLIIFTADHGDGLGCRHLATKHCTFYDETTRIPFIVSGAGVRSTGKSDRLISLIDLLPTLCDVAGTEAPSDLLGHSCASTWRGEDDRNNGQERKQEHELEHSYVVSQWHTEWGFTIEPGRMIRDQRWKYIAYREGLTDGSGEELYDLHLDPLEERNVIQQEPEQAARMRALFNEYLSVSRDNFMQLDPVVDPRWRQHDLGYHHHRGPAAPQA